MHPYIEQFFEMISWANETETLTIKGFEYLKSSHCLYAPCSWREVELFAYMVQPLAQEWNLEPTLLVGANPAKVDVYRISHKMISRNIHVSFVDVEAQLNYSQFVMEALDGLDWNRTLQAIAQGDSEPIWEWQ